MKLFSEPLKHHPLVRLFAGLAPVAMLVSGCGTPNRCRPTVTKARAAAAVDVTEISRSGVLEARLTSRGMPVAGREVVFRMPRRDLVVAGRQHVEDVGAGETNAGGVATLDLKRAFPTDFVQDVTASFYDAVWEGDADFCGSHSRAVFEIAKTPALGAAGRPMMPAPRRTPAVVAIPDPAPLPQPAERCQSYLRRVVTDPNALDVDRARAACAA